MRWIYLSPHFDDAVLSCGGLIHSQSRQGQVVEIWTIFAGDPHPGPRSEVALKIHALWGTGDGAATIALRKEEDQAAAGCVGADVVHFDFADCIYRRGPGGAYLYPESVFVPPVPADADLPARIAGAIESELLPGDILVCPLALGGHVDHIVARQAIECLGRPLRYYADFPYLVNYPDALAPAVAGLQAELFPLSEDDLRLWQAGVAAYASQISSLLREPAPMDDVLRAYWQQRQGICLWQAG